MTSRFRFVLFIAMFGVLMCAEALAQLQLPRPEAPFAGKIGLTYKDSTAVKLELIETQVTLVSPNVATETGIARVILPEQAPSETVYETVHVKTADGWKIDSLRKEMPAAAAPSNYEHLGDASLCPGLICFTPFGAGGMISATSILACCSHGLIQSLNYRTMQTYSRRSPNVQSSFLIVTFDQSLEGNR